MTNSTISALPSATTLSGPEVLPIVQGGANKKFSGAGLFALNNGIKRRTIGFLGESNGSRAGSLTYYSWLWWALALKPRHINYNPSIHNCAVSGSASGPSYNPSTGAIITAGTDGTDMFTPIIKAKALAAGVDDWFLSPNGNDSKGGSDTTAYSSYRNNRDMVDYLRANGGGKRFIFWSCILPKSSPAPQSYVPQLHAYMRAWAASTDDVFFIDLAHLLVNDTTGYTPWATGVNYGPINDGVGHVAPYGAYIIAKYMNDYLDLIGGFPLANLRNTNTLDAWSATLTGANVYKSSGSFFGTNPGGAYIGANASGVTVPGSIISTTSPELTIAGSIVSTTVKGQAHNSLRLTFAATTTLTALRSATITFGPGGSGNIALSSLTKANPHRSQLCVIPNALVNCCGIMLNYTGNDGTTTYNNMLGSIDSAISALPTLSDPLFLIHPYDLDFSLYTTSVSPSLQVAFPVGTATGALGSIDLAMNGLWGNLPLPYP